MSNASTLHCLPLLHVLILHGKHQGPQEVINSLIKEYQVQMSRHATVCWITPQNSQKCSEFLGQVLHILVLKNNKGF